VLHLDEAIQVAVANQPSLVQAQALAAAAEGQTIVARSPLLPQATGLASFLRQHSTAGATSGAGSGAVAIVPGARPSTYNTFRIGVTGTQTLWDPVDFAGWEASQRNAESLNATVRTSLKNLVLQVRTAYFAARAYRDLVGVGQETLENQLSHLRQVEGFVQVGTQPEVALALARLNVANARVSVITAQNNYRIAKAQLNQSMGSTEGTDYQVADDELAPLDVEERPLPGLFDIALSSRPELAALEYSRQAQGKTLDSTRWQWSPSLGFSGGYSKIGTSVDSLYDTWNFGLTLTWNFLQGGFTTGQIKVAEQNLKAATAALTVEQLQVRFDVEQAQATLLANKESLVAAKDAVANGKEQLRLAEGRYQTGVGSIIELSDAQLQATQAAAQLVQAQYNVSTARAQLLAALGRGE
jgi:outer membrane protein